MFSPRQIEPPKDSLLYGLRRRAPLLSLPPRLVGVPLQSWKEKAQLATRRNVRSFVRSLLVFSGGAAKERAGCILHELFRPAKERRGRTDRGAKLDRRGSRNEEEPWIEGGRRTRGFFGNATRGTRDLCLARGRLARRGDLGPSRLGRERYTLPAFGSLAAFISERRTRRSEK